MGKISPLSPPPPWLHHWLVVIHVLFNIKHNPCFFSGRFTHNSSLADAPSETETCIRIKREPGVADSLETGTPERLSADGLWEAGTVEEIKQEPPDPGRIINPSKSTGKADLVGLM